MKHIYDTLEQVGTLSFQGNTINLKDRARAYVFTVNNYKNDDIENLKNYFDTLTQPIYVIGKEIGEKNKTKHLQGFIKCKNPIRFNSLKKIIPNGHIERMKGNLSQNITYCTKENDYITNIGYLNEKKLKIELHIGWADCCYFCLLDKYGPVGPTSVEQKEEMIQYCKNKKCLHNINEKTEFDVKLKIQ